MPRTARHMLVILLLAAAPTLVAALVHPRAPGFSPPTLQPGEVSLATVHAWGQDVLWIDARSEAAYSAGHIPSALRLNLTQWDTLLPDVLRQWSPEMKIVVYCDSQSCSASHDLAQAIRSQLQIPEVYVLHGGWQAWREANP